MNRVHEQCLKIDSGTVLSQTGPKTGRVHQVHSPQPSGAPKRAHMAVSWRSPPAPYRSLARPYRGLGRPYRSVHALALASYVAGSVADAPARLALRLYALCRRPSGRIVTKCRARQHHVVALSSRVSRHSPAGQAPPYVTIQNLASQYNSLPALQPQSRYKLCIVTLLSSQPTACNTKPFCNTIPSLTSTLLQYNPVHCNTISAPLGYNIGIVLQYNPMSSPACNTLLVLQHTPQQSSKTTILQYNWTLLQYNWAVAHPVSAPTFFFFRFSSLFFLSFILLETPKKNIYIFFSFSNTSN